MKALGRHDMGAFNNILKRWAPGKDIRVPGRERGKPKMVVSDNGTELTSNAILTWADQSRVVWHYITPSKPCLRDSTVGCGMNC